MSTFLNVIRTAELRNKILFTLFIIAVYRLGVQLPSPGVSLDGIQSLRDQSSEASGGVFGYLNILTGGGIGSLSIFSLGILPYITASIIIQILTVAIPKLEEWQSQGAVGQRKITQWTRYLSLMLALIQSSGLVFIVHRNPQQFFGVEGGVGLFPDNSVFFGLLAVCCITVGTAIVMWMGELVTQKGIGNGMSVLIFASVVASLPTVGIQIYTLKNWVWLLFAIGLLALLCAGIVFVENGQRKIPVKFSKRVVGRQQTGGHSSFIPLKVNQAGVIPVIFASSLLQLPSMITNALDTRDENSWQASVSRFIEDNLFQPDNLGYILVFGLMIVGFSYFYNAIQFDPARRADDLRKQGGFIPPMRPGPETEKYLTKILNRITFPGSLFLAIVALIPSAALARLLGDTATGVGFSGVSVLISVGVALELMKQINNQLMARNYEGFLK